MKLKSYREKKPFQFDILFCGNDIALSDLFLPGGGRESSIDSYAHLAGGMSGLMLALGLASVPNNVNKAKLAHCGDIVSYAFGVLLFLAYVVVLHQHVTEGPDLLERAYVKWLGVKAKGPGAGRRATAPGALTGGTAEEKLIEKEDEKQKFISTERRLLKESEEPRKKSLPDIGGRVIY